jgi:ATP-dependent 26S proteasome regulatory subunit
MGNTKEYNKKYYEKNKNKLKKYKKEYFKEYYENNKEKINEHHKDCYKKNKEEFSLTTSIWAIISKWNNYLNKNSNICNTIDFKTFYLIRKLRDEKLIHRVCVRLGHGIMTVEEVNEILNKYKIEFTMYDYKLFKEYHLLGYLATNSRDGLLLKLI